MKTYIINMKTSVQRRQAMSAQLEALHMNYMIIDAVDGRKYSEEELNRIVDKRGEFTGAQAGCVLSHLKVYEEMQQSEEEFALILEDDSLLVDKKFSELIDMAVQRLNPNSITLLTYFWCRENSLVLNRQHRSFKPADTEYDICTPKEVHGIGRSGAYLISKQTARKLLEFQTPKLICQADSWVVYHEQGIVSHVDCIYPMPVTENPDFGSEIGYTTSTIGRLGKKLVEKTMTYNVPVLSNIIRNRRESFSKRYKNITVR